MIKSKELIDRRASCGAFGKMRNLAIMARRAGRLFIFRLLIASLFIAVVSGLRIDFHKKQIAGTAPAHACISSGCCISNWNTTRNLIITQHIATRNWVTTQFRIHREQFIVYYWFKEHVLAAMMMMNEQLVSMAMNQMFIVGGFFDAEIQLGTQRLFQQLEAQAQKDYLPSEGLCEIGTIARSLAASQRKGEYNAYALSQHMQDRQFRNWSMSSASGKDLDIVHRWEQFRKGFCNPHDDDKDLGQNTICQAPSSTTPGLRNTDVDYGGVVDYPLTIDADFSNNTLDPGDERVFGLASNLYGHDVFAYFPEAFFQNLNNQDEYMYVRSVVAKRSVAQNSFNAIIGMKSQSSAPMATNLRPYMEKVLEQLGITDTTNFQAYLGNRPSYYAQMEFLTKRLYQRPEFYTGLYDTPANVDRKKTAMRALGLAQNMDLFKSKLRTEAALAVLTEMELHKEQERIQNRFNAVRDTGRK